MSLNDLNVLMLTWEYPPVKIGGISEHVYELSHALVRKGMHVHVITVGKGPIASDDNAKSGTERSGLLHVHRVDVFSSDIKKMNDSMKTIAERIMSEENVDLIHAHDWMVCDAALYLKFKFKKPLVTTMHSTEFGRSQGIRSEYQMRIHEAEERLVRYSDAIIVCSKSMREEINALFPNNGEIYVIPNGTNISKFEFDVHVEEMKRKFCGFSNAKMILFVGRLVYQKGVNVLIGAMPKVLSREKDAFLVVVGDGPMRTQLERDAFFVGVAHAVRFAGFLDDFTTRCLIKSADVVVVPSLYEPFGIVALEAMSARTPLVVSDVGGLSEIVGDAGVKVSPDNSDELASGILKVLSMRDSKSNALNEIVEKAFRRALSLNWDKIASQTIHVYRNVCSKYSKYYKRSSISSKITQHALSESSHIHIGNLRLFS